VPAVNGTVDLRPQGDFVYVPAPGFSGTDTFNYIASDGTLDSNVATVTITVKTTNTPPVAIASLLGSANLSACIAPPGGMLAWYPGDGNPNDIIGPYSPNGIIGSPQFIAARVGQGIKFGGNDGLIVPDAPALRFGTTSFSVDAWVRVDGKGVNSNNDDAI